MTTSTAIEFLVWTLIAASLIAVVANRLRVPYTVALVIGGLALGAIHFPIIDIVLAHQPHWLTPDVVLIVFLPPLVFEGSLKMQVWHLRQNLVPIVLMASLGVLAATLITGYAVHWESGIPIMAALTFGAITAATDPISVLAIFKDLPVSKRLSVIVEGESLFNDGTAAVMFGIIVAAASSGQMSIGAGIRDFFVVVLGGAAVGLLFGYAVSKVTERIDEPRIEITLTTVLAYGAYLAADALHVSGVIATVAAGLMVGNFAARVGMRPHTRVSLWSFWEYAAFVINSIVFLLIGLQVHVGEMLAAGSTILLAVGAVLLGRILSVYGLTPLSNLLTEKIPHRWQTVLVLGGMRGSLSLALAMSLALGFPYRSQILAMTFGVVAFTIIVQGLAIKPALRLLGIVAAVDDEYAQARARQIALSASLAELNELFAKNLVSPPVYDTLRREVVTQLEGVKSEVARLFTKDETRGEAEFLLAKKHLISAEKSSIEQSLHEGLISQAAATSLIDEADNQLDQLFQRDAAPQPPPPAAAEAKDEEKSS
jgi:CPA1 family monovalent cation:H+ antiporter